jgi:hypothetical protein
MRVSLAKEIRLLAAQIRGERPQPSDGSKDWSATAERIRDEISDLMQEYEDATRPTPPRAPQLDKEQRLKVILKLVVAEL